MMKRISTAANALFHVHLYPLPISRVDPRLGRPVPRRARDAWFRSHPSFPHWLIDPRRVTERDFSPLKIRHRSRTTRRGMHGPPTVALLARISICEVVLVCRYHRECGGFQKSARTYLKHLKALESSLPAQCCVSGHLKLLFRINCFYSYISVTSPRRPFPP